MKKIVLLLIALVGCARAPLVVRAQVDSNSNSDTVTVSFSDPSRPGTLQVKLFQGTVRVTANNSNEVTITSRNRGRGNRRGPGPEDRGLRRLTTGLGVSEANNVILIGSNGFDRMDFDIQVPARTNLKLDSAFGGNIEATGIAGDIEVTNLNGSVTLTDVSGSVVTHSTNGRVLVTMKQVTPQKPMAFTSVNGTVDVTLPPDTRANLRLRTTNGDAYTDFDIQMNPPAARPVSRGKFGVEKDITGTINGGGPDFELRTVNGNVYIRKAK